jgi:hypothetical protein
MREILKFISGKRSKMVLYTYDAFLIDTHPTEKVDILSKVKEILERGNLPVRAYEGKNYNDLEVIL